MHVKPVGMSANYSSKFQHGAREWYKL